VNSKIWVVGARVKLFPRDSLPKIGVIEETTEYGVSIKIVKIGESSAIKRHNWVVGEVVYYPWLKVELALEELQPTYSENKVSSDFE
jgi:hypothetical protein